MTKYLMCIYLGAYMHIHTKYEVSTLNPVAGRAVHRYDNADANDTHDMDNYTR